MREFRRPADSTDRAHFFPYARRTHSGPSSLLGSLLLLVDELFCAKQCHLVAHRPASNDDTRTHRCNERLAVVLLRVPARFGQSVSYMHRKRAYQLAMCTCAAKRVVRKSNWRAKESVWYTSKTGTLAATTASYSAHDAVKR